MDAFKQNEILRMQHGGNKAWQDFYNANIGSENGGKTFEDSTIKERYESDVGDEWKERLSAKVEDRDFDREAWKKEREAYKARAAANASRSQTPSGGGGGPRKGASSSRSDSPAPGAQSQKDGNEAFFSSLGATNASRPADLPPSQGGRYAGFGSSPSPPSSSTNPNLPTTSDFQSDPVASITKSFGWLTTSLTRTAKTVNESYIQPTAKTIASSDLAAQARLAAMQAGTGLQNSAKTASESFNRFVEGQEHPARSGAREEPERKDFWDSFGANAAAGGAEAGKARPSSIGTAAMKTAGSTAAGNGPLSGGSGSGAASTPGGGGPPAAGKGDDGWDDW